MNWHDDTEKPNTLAREWSEWLFRDDDTPRPPSDAAAQLAAAFDDDEERFDVSLVESRGRAPAPRTTPELVRGAVLAVLRDAGGPLTHDELSERVARRFAGFPAREQVSVLTTGAVDAAAEVCVRTGTVLLGSLVFAGAAKPTDAVTIRGREQRSGARWFAVGDDHDRWLTAVHEAGHAALTALCGSGTVRAVTVGKDAGACVVDVREGFHGERNRHARTVAALGGIEAVRAIIGGRAAERGAADDMRYLERTHTTAAVLNRARAEAARLVARERPAILDAAVTLFRAGRLTPPQIGKLVEGVRARNASTFKL